MTGDASARPHPLPREQPSSALRARVLLAASQKDAATRQRVKRRDALLAFSACLVPLLVFAAFGGVREGPRPQALVLQPALGAAALALAATVVGFSRGRSTLGRAGIWSLGLMFATPAALFGWKVLMSAQFDNMMVNWPARVGFRCLGLSCLMAVWPLAAFLIARRASDPVHPALTGAPRVRRSARGFGSWSISVVRSHTCRICLSATCCRSCW